MDRSRPLYIERSQVIGQGKFNIYNSMSCSRYDTPHMGFSYIHPSKLHSIGLPLARSTNCCSLCPSAFVLNSADVLSLAEFVKKELDKKYMHFQNIYGEIKKYEAGNKFDVLIPCSVCIRLVIFIS